jgi:hypothetical protein
LSEGAVKRYIHEARGVLAEQLALRHAAERGVL